MRHTGHQETALGLNTIPGEAALRQRLDKQAKRFLPLVEQASIDFLRQTQPEPTKAMMDMHRWPYTSGRKVTACAWCYAKANAHPFSVKSSFADERDMNTRYVA